MAASEAIQKISRLTPLADVQLMIDAEVKAVTQRTIDVSAGAGRTLAVDALAPARPAAALALQDGWAVSADETLGAGGYAPSPLVRTPSRIEAGQAAAGGNRQCCADRHSESRRRRLRRRSFRSTRVTVCCRLAATATRRFRSGAPANDCVSLILPHFPQPALRA